MKITIIEDYVTKRILNRHKCIPEMGYFLVYSGILVFASIGIQLII